MLLCAAIIEFVQGTEEPFLVIADGYEPRCSYVIALEFKILKKRKKETRLKRLLDFKSCAKDIFYHFLGRAKGWAKPPVDLHWFFEISISVFISIWDKNSVIK